MNVVELEQQMIGAAKMREAAALAIEEQGRLLKIMVEDDRYDALIGDLARMTRNLSAHVVSTMPSPRVHYSPES